MEPRRQKESFCLSMILISSVLECELQASESLLVC